MRVSSTYCYPAQWFQNGVPWQYWLFTNKIGINARYIKDPPSVSLVPLCDPLGMGCHDDACTTDPKSETGGYLM